MKGFPSLRDLGRTGLRISAIGLGCWQFSRNRGMTGKRDFLGKYWSYIEQEQIDDIVGLSLAGGINWFDTAEAYGGGESERVLARALRRSGRKPGQVVIATKWRPVFRRAPSIVKTIDVRLKNLDGYPIDLYQIHNPYSLSSVGSQIAAMAELVRQKKIRYVGVSNFSAARMRQAAVALQERGLVLASNQVRYSLLHRRIESNGVLEAAKELGVTIIAYSPLAQGILSGKFHDDPNLIKTRQGLRKHMPAFKPSGLAKSRPVVQAVREIAAKHGATPSQVALSWLINGQGPSIVAIPGATSPEQAKDNVGALTVELSRSELDDLAEVSAAFKK